MLPDRGPRPHPYYAIDHTFVEVAFTDVEGTVRRHRVRQKTTGDGPPLVLEPLDMTCTVSEIVELDT